MDKKASKEDLASQDFIQSLTDFQVMMKAMAAKFQGIQRKQRELEDDFVRIMVVQGQQADRLFTIEETYHKAGIPGFRTPLWKRIFKKKDHLSHLELKEKQNVPGV